MRMIDWWIEQAGPRPYLMKIKQSYDHGYNHGDLSEMSDADKAELRHLVQRMLDTGYEAQEGPEIADTVRAAIVEFRTLLDIDLEGTLYGSTNRL